MPQSTESQAGPKIIEAGINYIPPLKPGESERVYLSQSVGHRRSREFVFLTQQVTDMRGHENEYELDTHGFQLVLANPVPEDIDDAKMKAQVYPDVEDLLKRVTGASYVHIFSDIVRRDPYQALLDLPSEIADEEPCKLQTPSMNAHIGEVVDCIPKRAITDHSLDLDQSYYGARQMIEGGILQDPQLRAKSGTRWGIINVWKPLKPVTREPLAVCDARSIPDSDLQQTWLKIQLPQKDIMFGMWYVQHGEGQKWYWPSEMQPDEALLIKCFDTKMDGRARRSPHSAIRTPNDYGSTRESVEIRTLCFWEDQEKE